MIAEFFPQSFQRYQSLPLLGPSMDSYAGWLREQQYTWRSTRYELRMAARIADYLTQQGVCEIGALRPNHIDACHRWFRRKFPKEAGAVVAFRQFLQKTGRVEISPLAPPRYPGDIHVMAFMVHLADVRGFVPSTIRRQGQIAAEFLTWLRFGEAPDRLSALTTSDLEGFFRHLSKRMGRVGLQKPIAVVRNFLRFLAADGTVPVGLGDSIERPRVYRHEQLPRSLPWSTIQAFLDSINRDSPTGKRDYAMFRLCCIKNETMAGCLLASYAIRSFIGVGSQMM